MNKNKDFEYYRLRADPLFAPANLSRTLIHYSRAAKTRPKALFIYKNWAKALGKLHKYKEAEAKYRKLCAETPCLAANYNSWGLLLDDQGKYAEAEEKYMQALKINPVYFDAFVNLAIVLSLQRKFDEAINTYKRTLELTSRDSVVYNNLGSLYLRMGKLEQAIEKYKEAIELTEDYYLPYLNSSVAYFSLGREVEGNRAYEMGIRLLDDLPSRREWMMKEYKIFIDQIKEELDECEELEGLDRDMKGEDVNDENVEDDVKRRLLEALKMVVERLKNLKLNEENSNRL